LTFKLLSEGTFPWTFEHSARCCLFEP